MFVTEVSACEVAKVITERFGVPAQIRKIVGMAGLDVERGIRESGELPPSSLRAPLTDSDAGRNSFIPAEIQIPG
jgi:hypothetical protein